MESFHRREKSTKRTKRSRLNDVYSSCGYVWGIFRGVRWWSYAGVAQYGFASDFQNVHHLETSLLRKARALIIRTMEKNYNKAYHSFVCCYIQIKSKNRTISVIYKRNTVIPLDCLTILNCYMKHRSVLNIIVYCRSVVISPQPLPNNSITINCQTFFSLYHRCHHQSQLAQIQDKVVLV